MLIYTDNLKNPSIFILSDEGDRIPTVSKILNKDLSVLVIEKDLIDILSNETAVYTFKDGILTEFNLDKRKIYDLNKNVFRVDISSIQYESKENKDKILEEVQKYFRKNFGTDYELRYIHESQENLKEKITEIDFYLVMRFLDGNGYMIINGNEIKYTFDINKSHCEKLS